MIFFVIVEKFLIYFRRIFYFLILIFKNNKIFLELNDANFSNYATFVTIKYLTKFKNLTKFLNKN